jgi:uncharacterized membrane protein HdeD (DUF308 family)
MTVTIAALFVFFTLLTAAFFAVAALVSNSLGSKKWTWTFGAISVAFSLPVLLRALMNAWTLLLLG